MTYVAFEAADEIGDRFLELLSRLDIKPTNRSKVEDELLSLTELIGIMRNPNQNYADEVEVLRRAAGLHDFAAKILSVEGLPEFKEFESHLKMLGANTDAFSTLIQNSRATLPNDTNRKLTELYIASLIINLSTTVSLDSPTSAKGDNPDILFKYCGDSQLWALAIKSVSAQSGQTYFERVKEAAKQIDSESCKAGVGLILINVKDSLDHDALWGQVFPDEEKAAQALQQQINDCIQKAGHNRPQEEWDALFLGKVVRPVLFMAHSLVRIGGKGGAFLPTSIKTVVAYNAYGEPNPKGTEIALGLNHFMQTVLQGLGGSDNILPS